MSSSKTTTNVKVTHSQLKALRGSNTTAAEAARLEKEWYEYVAARMFFDYEMRHFGPYFSARRDVMHPALNRIISGQAKITECKPGGVE